MKVPLECPICHGVMVFADLFRTERKSCTNRLDHKISIDWRYNSRILPGEEEVDAVMISDHLNTFRWNLLQKKIEVYKGNLLSYHQKYHLPDKYITLPYIELQLDRCNLAINKLQKYLYLI